MKIWRTLFVPRQNGVSPCTRVGDNSLLCMFIFASIAQHGGLGTCNYLYPTLSVCSYVVIEHEFSRRNFIE